MKSSRMKKILAVILCLTLGLSTNMMTMAESVNSPAVESVQEDPAGSGKEQTVENAALQTTSVENTETEAVQPTEAPVPTEAPTPEATPAPTETAVPEVTAEPTEAPVEAVTPVPTETPTPEVTAEPTEMPVEETTPVPTETPTPEVTELPEITDSQVNYEDMSVEELYQYLSSITNDNERQEIIDSLSTEKISQLEQYSNGNIQTYAYGDVVKSLDSQWENISQGEWDTMKTAADNELNSTGGVWTGADNKEYKNIPILNWQRSSQNDSIKVEKITENNTEPWTWSEIKNIETSVSGNAVWDGSRSAGHNFEDSSYLSNKEITAIENNGSFILYDSATWKQDMQLAGSWGDPSYVQMFRFSGTVDLNGIDLNTSSFTLVPVTDDGKIYINDDIFVFVYPEGTQLSDNPEDPNYYLNYMAFWTGTSNQDGTIKFAGDEKYVGTLPVKGDATGLAALTNGWYMPAAENNVGSVISYGHQINSAATTYKVDIFTDDYAAGGGMYRLKMGYIENRTNVVKFQKVKTDNTGLAGAEFGLYQDNKLVDRATSDANGEVEFSAQLYGEYTLKEISAPEGYEKDTTVWTVHIDSSVTINGQSQTEFKVTNRSDEEEALESLIYSKNAEVSNYDKREYTIHLNASTSGSTGGEQGQNASIVLVLDNSGSMGYQYGNAINSLKTAVKGFIDDIVEEVTKINAGNVQISIITFSSYVTGNQPFITIKDDSGIVNNSGVETLKRMVTNMTANGGTDIGSGLEAAYGNLEKAKFDNKYVIAFTDGKPDRSYYSTTQLADDAYSWANEIKNDGNTMLYTIGLGNQMREKFEWDSVNNPYRGTGGYWMKNPIVCSKFLEILASPNKAYTIDTPDSLEGVFESIQGEIAKPNVISTEYIQDVVDSRFEVINASGNGEIIKNQDGTTTVKWNAAEITNSGWEETITVKAKDDFIGGNAIKTNIAEQSGIKIPDQSLLPFNEKPTVNVKLLDLSADESTSTVFINDTIKTSELLKNAVDNLKMQQIDEKQIAIPENCLLTEAELTTLLNGSAQAIQKRYSYGQTNDMVGTFIYTVSVDSVIGGQLEEHIAVNTGKPAECYYLSVEFVPDSLQQRPEEYKNSLVANPGTEVTDDKNATGIRKVNVVAGTIEISKKIDQTKVNSSIEGNPIFTFKIEYKGPDDTEYSIWGYRTIEFTSADSDLKAAEIISDLSRGTYRITELDTQKFTFDSVTTDGTSCDVNINKSTVEFTIGEFNNQEDFKALIGKAVYSNDKTGPGTNTDTDVVVNRFIYDETTGEWTVKQIWNPGEGQQAINPVRTEQ